MGRDPKEIKHTLLIPLHVTNDKTSQETFHKMLGAWAQDGPERWAADAERWERLRVKMTEDSQKLLRAEKWGGAGNVSGHLQQGAPPMAPYVFRDIVSNPFVIQVTKRVLGNGVTGPGGKMFNSFYGGNTSCPGSQEQALHRDHPHLWPDLEQAHPPFAVAINIPLVQVTEENGATELWPGSHLNTKAFLGGSFMEAAGPIDDDDVAAQRQIAPPIRAETEKGSIVIRDMRLWHRGMTNHSNEIRHMINMNHCMYWRVRRQTLRFAAGCEAALTALTWTTMPCSRTSRSTISLGKPWGRERAIAPGRPNRRRLPESDAAVLGAV